MNMATSADSVHESSDFVKDFSCVVCESKNIETSADIFCETCLKCFCQNCLYHHDQMFVNHSTHGRGEQNKWPLIQTMEALLLKCDVHRNKKLKMFCQDHRQLCCSDCVLLNHRQCTSLALISESVKKLSVDMKQLSNKIQTTLAKLNKYKRTQEVSNNFVEESYNEKLQEIREMRRKFNADFDGLENATLKELDEIRITLQTSLKKDIDNCSRLKDELQHLSEAVQGLCDKSKKDLEFIASSKCLDKIHEFESYLKENPVKVQSPMIFQANTDLVQYLTKQSCLGRTIKMNQDQVLTVKSKSEYNVAISSDTSQTCFVTGVCSLPSGHVILADNFNKNVKLLDQHNNVSSHCDMSGPPTDICQITSSEVAVSLGNGGVQFLSVRNGQLVKGRKLKLPHKIDGIAHHQGALYVTSGNALYHYTLAGTLVKKLYEDTGGQCPVFRCAVSLFGDRIYFIDGVKGKLLTLATDGSLISTFTDPELRNPFGVHVTPAGQVIVCDSVSHTVMQIDHEGRKKLATLASQKDGLIKPLSVCCNTSIQQIIVGHKSNKIILLELQ